MWKDGEHGLVFSFWVIPNEIKSAAGELFSILSKRGIDTSLLELVTPSMMPQGRPSLPTAWQRPAGGRLAGLHHAVEMLKLWESSLDRYGRKSWQMMGTFYNAAFKYE